jgi:acylphosphatase
VKQLKIEIRGLVQGVGYRYFTQKIALKLGVIGTVENLKDGSVKVCACADELTMQQFLDELKQGPRLSSVREIQHKAFQDENFFRELNTFTIVRS